MKVYELAKEIGVDKKEIIDFLGDDIKSHLNVLNEEQISQVRDNFSNSVAKENEELKARLAKMEEMMQSLMEKQTVKTVKAEAEDTIKDIPMTKSIKVMSLFDGGLNLKTSRDGSGQTFRFEFVGETYPILYADLIKSINLQRWIYKDGYCMILDQDVVKTHYLENDYNKFVDAEVINNILEYEDEKIKDIFSNVTPVIQRSIVDVVINKINGSENVDKNKVAVVGEVYGKDIFELASKMR